MKTVISTLLIVIGEIVSVISFWVWLGSFLIWKIFAVSGALGVISPACYIMIGGVGAIILGFLLLGLGE